MAVSYRQLVKDHVIASESAKRRELELAHAANRENRLRQEKEEKDRKWETIITILRKTADDIEYIVFACSSDPEWLDEGEDEDCEGGDIVFKEENPFLPDDRVMITLAINKQAW